MEKETKRDIKKCREEFRRWLVKWTGCDCQGNKEIGYYPCGTCACDLLADLGVKETLEHNHPIDRVNEVWRAILQIRGDYKEGV